MSELCRIVVPWDVSRTSLNQHLHWRERARRNTAAKQAAAYGWELAGRPQAAGPVTVSLIVRRARRLDDDNALTGAKPVRDLLFSPGHITPDDSPKWVRLGTVEQEIGREWKGREEVVVIVETRETPAPPARGTGRRKGESK